MGPGPSHSTQHHPPSDCGHHVLLLCSSPSEGPLTSVQEHSQGQALRPPLPQSTRKDRCQSLSSAFSREGGSLEPQMPHFLGAQHSGSVSLGSINVTLTLQFHHNSPVPNASCERAKWLPSRNVDSSWGWWMRWTAQTTPPALATETPVVHISPEVARSLGPLPLCQPVC